ncbi:ATP-grasp domain-containing protein [Longispora sp. K20-0274]|uniref:carboxylate--amine ligase n=1 Tax=Longispora sp. K20-0274 TaxID=3088255 RepID=UPI00399A016B
MRTGAVVIGGDYQGLGIVRSLGRHGVPVLVLDNERSIAAASRYTGKVVRVPGLRDDEDTLRALDGLRRRFGLAGWVLYATREETVAALSRHRADLARHWRVPTPDWDSVRYAWDKRETYRLAQKLGIGVPRSWFPMDEADLAQVDGDGPFAVKPAIKEHFFYATGVKAWRADGRAELLAAFRRAAAVVPAGEVVVQELVPGGGETQLAWCGLFRDGRPVASMTARRLRQHPSEFGRASTFVETVAAPELEGPSTRFLAAIGYHGLVEVEYKVDPRDGEPKLLDVNARTWGYHTLGRAAGVDFPYLLFLDQLGRPVPRVAARPGVRWIRLATDLPNAVVDWRAGRLRTGAYLASLLRVRTEAVLSWSDPLPALYEVALAPHLATSRGL